MEHRASQEYMTQIIEARHQDIEREKELVSAMLKDYIEEPESYEYVFAKVYYIDILLADWQIRKVIEEGNLLYPVLEKRGYEELDMTLANMMAIAFKRLEDKRSALACYFKGMELAEKLGRTMMIGTFYFNIGQLYHGLGEYEKAEQMLKTGMHYLLKTKDNRGNVRYSKDLYHLALAQIRLDMGKIDNARSMVEMIRQEDLRVNVMLLQSRIAFAQGNREKAKDYIGKILELEEEQGLMELEDMQDLAILVLKMQERSILSKVKELYQRKTEKCDSLAARVKYYDWLTGYYTEYGLKEQLFQSYEKYYEYSRKQEKNQKRIYLKQVKDRERIESTRHQNSFIENYKMHMKDLAQRDELTGAVNRSGMELRLQELFPKSQREQTAFGAIFVDVDYFKEYNDQYGHLAGDQCLKEIYEAIAEAVEEPANVIRYGGDEFVILLSGWTDLGIEKLLERIREEVRRRAIQSETSRISDHVTVTMGAVNKVPDHWETPDQYVRAADEQLYQIKKSTRDGYAVTHEIQ